MDKTYFDIECKVGMNLKDAVQLLSYYQKLGVPASMDFNGHKLLSDGIDLDKTYLEVTGKTYEDIMKEKEQFLSRYAFTPNVDERKEELIKKSIHLIDKSKWEIWRAYINENVNNAYCGEEMFLAVSLMELMSVSNDFYDVSEELDKSNLSETAYGIVLALIEIFSIRGEEFLQFIERKKEVTNYLHSIKNKIIETVLE